MLKGTILDKTLDVVFENFKAGKKMVFLDGYDTTNIHDVEMMSLNRIRLNLKRKDTILLLLEREGEDEE